MVFSNGKPLLVVGKQNTDVEGVGQNSAEYIFTNQIIVLSALIRMVLTNAKKRKQSPMDSGIYAGKRISNNKRDL